MIELHLSEFDMGTLYGVVAAAQPCAERASVLGKIEAARAEVEQDVRRRNRRVADSREKNKFHGYRDFAKRYDMLLLAGASHRRAMQLCMKGAGINDVRTGERWLAKGREK